MRLYGHANGGTHANGEGLGAPTRNCYPSAPSAAPFVGAPAVVSRLCLQNSTCDVDARRGQCGMGICEEGVGHLVFILYM